MSTDTKQQTFSEIIKGETPVLVDFYADWCAPCKMMVPILQELKSKMGDSLNILKIDTDRNPDAAIKYQVRGIPTLILFKEGNILWQQAGVVRTSQLEAIINQKLSEYESV
ncbi:MAG: thioredoxin [Balneolaceae bacterium]|nr:MAG: thioredoxin [Balneolaceae bacterium]